MVTTDDGCLIVQVSTQTRDRNKEKNVPLVHRTSNRFRYTCLPISFTFDQKNHAPINAELRVSQNKHNSKTNSPLNHVSGYYYLLSQISVGTIHRCIDASRYVSRDSYRDTGFFCSLD